MKVEDKAEQISKTYVRAIEPLVRFHSLTHPKELDIDEVLEFLISLTEHRQSNWLFLAPRFKARNLKFIRKHLKVCPPEVIEYKNTRDFITATTGIDPHLCPKCHKGAMVISHHPSACFSFLSMSRMDIDSARAEISQSSKIRGSPYPDPDVKIYTRPIPAYRKVELR